MRLPSVRRFSEIRLLARSPTCAQGELLSIRVCRGEGEARFLIVVPSKCGKAVRRNRIRRIIREWCRKNFAFFPEGTLWMVRVLPAVARLSDKKLSPALRGELEELVRRCVGGFDGSAGHKASP